MQLQVPSALLIGVLISIGLEAQPVLHLKSQRYVAAEPAAEELSQEPRRIAARSHRILQFREAPDEAELRDLQARGAKVLDYVPDNAVLVSAADDLSLDGLPLIWTGHLEISDKLSEKLQYFSELTVVVEFHRDVTPGEMRELALRLRLTVHENPDLLPSQLLVSGEPDQIWQAAEWDEVAYIFPASEELIEGTPVRACAGAITSGGRIGQYTARVGEGWDGPGRNAASLLYALGALTDKLPPDVVRAEILRAMAEWSRYVRVGFAETGDGGANRSIAILFGAGSHGDQYPFDGPAGVLAHTFYPSPPNSEPLAGDLHLDGDEPWRTGGDIDVFSVVLHELGHALGLGHSDVPGSVMYPYYRQAAGLTSEDIGAIRQLYAAQEAESPVLPLDLTVTQPVADSRTAASSISVSGQLSGGSGAVRVSWTNDRGGAGESSLIAAPTPQAWAFAPVPVALGKNNLTITAVDDEGTAVSRSVSVTRVDPVPATPPTTPVEPTPVPPALFITSPREGPVQSGEASIVVTGNASHASGITRIEWNNSRGGRGIASGTAAWTVRSVPLFDGANTITVTAWSAAGTSASQAIQVRYTPQRAADRTSPSITIYSPASTNVSTTLPGITLSGAARDNGQVVEVVWATSTGAAGKASGTESWTTGEIPLQLGTNSVTVRARDAAGNTAWRAVTVTRR